MLITKRWKSPFPVTQICCSQNFHRRMSVERVLDYSCHKNVVSVLTSIWFSDQIRWTVFVLALKSLSLAASGTLSIHLWSYSPFRALASLTRRLHSSLFVALLLHPLVPSSCSASLWTTSAHLLLGLSTGLVVWKFPFRTFFGKWKLIG